KQRTGETFYPKYKDIAAGTVFEGTFSNVYKGEYGDTLFIDLADGNSVGLDVKANLRWLMEQANGGQGLRQGQRIQIIYNGLQEYTNKAGRNVTAHNFDLKVEAE